MGTELLFLAVLLLAGFAALDLMVGVSNDAVNFLNSSIGSRAAPRYVILGIATLGILAGVTFSSGMMEVARKGIFHPEFFTMPELLILFLAVMLTDVILLDMFNTFGSPLQPPFPLSSSCLERLWPWPRSRSSKPARVSHL